MNRKAFSRINYGLFIVGAELDGKPPGLYRQLSAPGHILYALQVFPDSKQE